MSNPLKLVALHWAHASIHGVRVQIPWDGNYPQYGKYHFRFAKGTLEEIVAYMEASCPSREKATIEAWMKGTNPTEIHVGIDCNGFVYRVLDGACRLAGAPTLVQSMGTTCEYTPLDNLTLPDQVITRASDIRAGDTIRFNKGWHSGVIIETVSDGRGRLRQIWYAHSSFKRGPHIGHVEIAEPDAPINDPSTQWIDDMWDDNLDYDKLRDRYFTSVHHSPFYKGPRPHVIQRTGVTILVEGRPIDFDASAYIYGERTMCQLRPLAEAIGAKVSWDPIGEMITLTLGKRKAQCQVGSEVGVADGAPFLMDEPPILVDDGHTMVMLRFVGEALGYNVQWDAAAMTANLVRTR